jgi:uncharacterized membrane protein
MNHNAKKKYLLSASVAVLTVCNMPSAAKAQMCPGNQYRQVECHDYKDDPIPEIVCQRLVEAGVMPPKPDTTHACEYACPGGDGGDGGGCGCGGPDPSSAGPDCDPSGDGGDGGKVLCGYYYTQGLIPPHIYQGDLEFSMHRVHSATRRGYLYWAVPLAEYLYNNPDSIMVKIVAPFVLGWAREMAFQTGYASEGHWLGKLELYMITPFVKLLGFFVAEKDWSHLSSKADFDDDTYVFQGDATAANYA